jgi:hypothetical protein
MKVPGTPPFGRFREKHVSAGDPFLPLVATASSTTEHAFPTFDRLLTAPPRRCAGRDRTKRSCRAAGPSSNHRTSGNVTLSTRATFAMNAPVVDNCNQTRQPIVKNRRTGYTRQSILLHSGYKFDQEQRFSQSRAAAACIDRVRERDESLLFDVDATSTPQLRVRKCKQVRGEQTGWRTAPLLPGALNRMQ